MQDPIGTYEVSFLEWVMWQCGLSNIRAENRAISDAVIRQLQEDSQCDE
jgi:hypothetical protein